METEKRPERPALERFRGKAVQTGEEDVAFTINTNITSMQAQEYLRTTGDFQAKTINRVTSGLRIINAGDDAAGLAIANTFRSDQAVLSQGIRNANDGLATLQTIDSGISNIGKLLDRARTLAAQAATGTFSGSRSVLNSEFQSVMGEVDRQAQAIGLNSNGSFAKNLSVFIGGGRTSGSTDQIKNGSVGIDLSKSTVDTQSLGMKGVQAGNIGYDLSTGATKVESIVTNANNIAGLATSGYTNFTFKGPGFGDSNGVTVRVNVNNVASTEALETAVNAAIEAAGTDPTASAQAFKNASIKAKIVTDADGKQQLAFSSSSSSFQVSGGDKMANALLGNYATGAEGANITSTTTGVAGAGGSYSGGEVLQMRFEGGGLTSPYTLSYTVSGTPTAAATSTALKNAIAADTTLRTAGISMTDSADLTTTPLVFSSASGQDVNVSVTGDVANRLGMGAFKAGAGGEFEYNTVTLANSTPINGSSSRFSFSFNGGAAVDVNLAWTTANIASDTLKADALNAAINNTAALQGSGLVATVSSGAITFTAGTGTNFRVQASGATTAGAFGGLTSLTSYAAPAVAGANPNSYVAAGSYQLGAAGTAAPLTFSAINFAGDDQALTVQATDTGGVNHKLDLKLDNTNARTLDEAINAINTKLQESNDSTLKGITAVKVIDGGVEKLNLVSSTKDFRLSVGTNASGTGLSQASSLVSSTQVGTGANASIDTQESAQAAVTALANAVTALGEAQAVVGKGQNQFNFAVSLASTQLTNIAASESRIRDADLALEAANLSKAQILQQAGVAALAQANSAPQAVLSLLRG